MSDVQEPVRGEDGFEASIRGAGGEVPMPSVAAEARNRAGQGEDQEGAEHRVARDRRRVPEGYVHPGEPHTDWGRGKPAVSIAGPAGKGPDMTDDTQDLAKLRELVGTHDIVMLTTLGHDGELEARPMSVQDFDTEGRLWFFTENRSAKVDELRRDSRALVTSSKRNHLSIQGTATVVRDPARQQELWDKAAEAWLQCEPTDPKVALVMFEPTGAQYWETPGMLAGALGVLTAAVKGERPDVGENETLDLER